MEIRHDITIGEAIENFGKEMRKLEQALLVALQPLADYYDMELERLRKMASALNELYQECDDYIETPETPSFAVEIPRYKVRFNMPKRTYFPKIRATARSTC